MFKPEKTLVLRFENSRSSRAERGLSTIHFMAKLSAKCRSLHQLGDHTVHVLPCFLRGGDLSQFMVNMSHDVRHGQHEETSRIASCGRGPSRIGKTRTSSTRTIRKEFLVGRFPWTFWLQTRWVSSFLQLFVRGAGCRKVEGGRMESSLRDERKTSRLAWLWDSTFAKRSRHRGRLDRHGLT